jgi:hypothetical protein
MYEVLFLSCNHFGEILFKNSYFYSIQFQLLIFLILLIHIVAQTFFSETTPDTDLFYSYLAGILFYIILSLFCVSVETLLFYMEKYFEKKILSLILLGIFLGNFLTFIYSPTKIPGHLYDIILNLVLLCIFVVAATREIEEKNYFIRFLFHKLVFLFGFTILYYTFAAKNLNSYMKSILKREKRLYIQYIKTQVQLDSHILIKKHLNFKEINVTYIVIDFLKDNAMYEHNPSLFKTLCTKKQNSYLELLKWYCFYRFC